jgi:hypothetical protein
MKNFPRQFAQFYSLYGGLGSTPHLEYVHPVLFTLLPDKKETVHCAEDLVFFLVTNIMKVDFEAAVVRTRLRYYWL